MCGLFSDPIMGTRNNGPVTERYELSTSEAAGGASWGEYFYYGTDVFYER